MVICLRWFAQFVGVSSCAPNVVGLIPGQSTYLGCGLIPSQGEYGRQLINGYFPHIDVSLSPFLFLSKNKKKAYLQARILKNANSLSGQ